MILKEKIVGNVKKFFKELNVLDYFIYILGIIGVIIASILVRSSAISIVTALFGVLYVRTLSKKYKISIIFGLIYVGMYILQSVIYKNWGEVIIYGGLSVPILIWTCVSWYKKSDKVQNHAISWKEWLILLSVVAVLSVGIYFMLWYFATPNLVIAVISSVVGLVGNYLILRQDGKMFFENVFCFYDFEPYTNFALDNTNHQRRRGRQFGNCAYDNITCGIFGI